MKERLQKILSVHGIASRRAAEKIISDGRVTVNGVAAQLGESADPEQDDIAVDGIPLRLRDKTVYLALNKPRGYVTTVSDEKNRKTVMELVQECGVRVYPIGRLDMNSDGLLLLTNDGELANRLCHPSGEKRKIYRVRVTGNVDAALPVLTGPMELDGYALQPVAIKQLRRTESGALLEFTLSEGRNRQIRRMCEQCGLKVHALTRVEYAGIRLGSLSKGEWRYLTEEEIDKLRK